MILTWNGYSLDLKLGWVEVTCLRHPHIHKGSISVWIFLMSLDLSSTFWSSAIGIMTQKGLYFN